MNNIMSYLFIKPDGLSFSSDIIHQLSKRFIIDKTITVDDFITLSNRIYLEKDAIERGNEPIIYGINLIWENYFKTTSAILLIVKPLEPTTQSDFIMDVCRFKKTYRKALFPKGYIEFQISPKDINYSRFGVKKPRKELLKKRLSEEGDYKLQLNCIHCPDSIQSYNREIKIIEDYLNFDFTK